MRTLVFLLFFFINIGYAQEVIRVIDDAHHKLEFTQPAQRIISLTPHLTEIIFALGAEQALVGTVEFSNYPEAAKEVTRIGNAASLNYEKILSLQPDLALGWVSGNPASLLEKLRQLHIPIYLTEPKTITAIEKTFLDIGQLTGQYKTALQLATRFDKNYQMIKKHYQGQKPLSVFYQIWHQPLYTVGQQHIISQALTLCGGQSIFPQLDLPAQEVSLEAIVAANPQLIISGSQSPKDTVLLRTFWQPWSSIDAVKYGQLYTVPAELISQYTPRLLEGIKLVCQIVEQARSSYE